jgi:DNA-binding transcriptional MerR regulator
MEWNIPGTVLNSPLAEAAHVEDRFGAMFLGGDIVLSQVVGITGMEPHTVQNWVKRGFLTKPEGKHYTLRQLCRILNINMFKNVMPLEQVCKLLSYVNGHLDDESDDMIDDSVLYFLFVRLASHYSVMHNPQGRDDYVKEVLRDYVEPVPGARERVEKVLRIMLTAWAASQLRKLAEDMTKELDEA